MLLTASAPLKAVVIVNCCLFDITCELSRRVTALRARARTTGYYKHHVAFYMVPQKIPSQLWHALATVQDEWTNYDNLRHKFLSQWLCTIDDSIIDIITVLLLLLFL